MKPGDPVFMNIVRTTRGEIDGAAMWVATETRTFHAADRLGGVLLERPEGGNSLPGQ